jgi:hypothetical protein
MVFLRSASATVGTTRTQEVNVLGGEKRERGLVFCLVPEEKGKKFVGAHFSRI